MYLLTDCVETVIFVGSELSAPSKKFSRCNRAGSNAYTEDITAKLNVHLLTINSLMLYMIKAQTEYTQDQT